MKDSDTKRANKAISQRVSIRQRELKRRRVICNMFGVDHIKLIRYFDYQDTQIVAFLNALASCGKGGPI